MTSLTLLRKEHVYSEDLGCYKVDLEVTASQGIAKEVFVKQRIREKLSNDFVDVFAAVATAIQMQTLPISVPSGNTSYFLDNKVSLLAKTPEYLETVVNSVQTDMRHLAEDVESLADLTEEVIVTITAT